MLSQDENWEVYLDSQRESRESDPRYIDPDYADACAGCPYLSTDPLMCTKSDHPNAKCPE